MTAPAVRSFHVSNKKWLWLSIYQSFSCFLQNTCFSFQLLINLILLTWDTNTYYLLAESKHFHLQGLQDPPSSPPMQVYMNLRGQEKSQLLRQMTRRIRLSSFHKSMFSATSQSVFVEPHVQQFQRWVAWISVSLSNYLGVHVRFPSSGAF